MVKLARTFRDFRSFKVLVLGDFMLDTYTTGKVKRISPEAPVPVMEVLRRESRPGGAGNVVLNLCALGAHVFAVGRIGDDPEGREIKQALFSAETEGLFVQEGYPTPVKNRLIADSQQLIRVDSEKILPIDAIVEKKVLSLLERQILQVDVLALSDYGKGFLSSNLIQKALEMARSANIPSVVDPKGLDFLKYRGATVLKPNVSEAYAAAKCSSHASLEEVASHLISLADTLFITRSEAGISLFDAFGRKDFPVRSKEVKDVTGAGDTVLSMICLGLANGLAMEQIAQLSNLAASLAIERLGCVQITLSELAERLLEYDSDTKVFDEAHLYALLQVLKGKKYTLVVLEKSQGISTSLVKALRELEQGKREDLLVYVRDAAPEDEWIHLLSLLPEVDYIILQTESLQNVCKAFSPHEIYFFSEEKLLRSDRSQELLESLLGMGERV